MVLSGELQVSEERPSQALTRAAGAGRRPSRQGPRGCLVRPTGVRLSEGDMIVLGILGDVR